MHTCDHEGIAKTAESPLPRDLFARDLRGLETQYLVSPSCRKKWTDCGRDFEKELP
jgi:hypothetical protein